MMHRRTVLALGWLLVAFPALAQIGSPGVPVVPLGFCQLTSPSAATKLSSCTGGIPTQPGFPGRVANMAVIRTETQNIRYRDDGVAPSASVGMLIATTDVTPLVYVGNLSAIQIIQVTTNATVDVAFYYSP